MSPSCDLESAGAPIGFYRLLRTSKSIHECQRGGFVCTNVSMCAIGIMDTYNYCRQVVTTCGAKKIISAAIPGGLAINAPENNKVENAFNRELNRVAGFGPGMASALIGNASRRGNSVTVNDTRDNRSALSSIGWGVQNSKLDQGVWRRLLPEMPHKKAFDFNGLRHLPHMDTSGKFALHLDQ